MPKRTYYTMTEAAVALGKDAKTLRGWMESAGMKDKATTPSTDRRTKRLTPGDVRKLAELHGVPLADDVHPLPGTRHKPSWKEMLARMAIQDARIEALESEVAALKGIRTSAWDRLASHATQDAPMTRYAGQEMGDISEREYPRPIRQRPSPAPRSAPFMASMVSSPGDTLPVEWQSLDKMAERHGQSMTTLKDNLERQAIRCHLLDEAPHPKGWKRGRNWITRAVSPDQLVAIFAAVPPRQLCEDSECPCHFGSHAVAIASPESPSEGDERNEE